LGPRSGLTVNCNSKVNLNSLSVDSHTTVVFFDTTHINTLNIIGTNSEVDFRTVAVLGNVDLSGGLSCSLIAKSPNAEVNITNSFQWSSCTVGVASGANARFNLLPECVSTFSGTGTRYIRSIMTNYGTIEYSSSVLGMNINPGGLTFINAPGAVFNAANDTGSLSMRGGKSNSFINQGTVNVNVLDTFQVEVAFDNQGTVNVLQGSLAMNYGGTHTGKFNHCDGCFINFNGLQSTTHTLAEESIVTDGRGIIFSARTTNVSGTFEPQYFQQIDGTTIFNNFYTSTDTIVISGGTLDFRGSAELANVELFGSQTKFIAASSNSEVNITNSFKWQGDRCEVGNAGKGRFNLLSSCRSTISGNGTQYLRTQMTNYGQVDYFPPSSETNIQITGGLFINAPGAVFNVSSTSGSVGFSTSADRFVNQGLLRISVPASDTFTFSNPFSNEGHVEVLSGTLAMNGLGATHSGNFTHNNDTFIRFGAGTHTLTETSVVNAGNGIVFAGASITIQGTFLPETFHVIGGSVTFDNAADSLSFCSIAQSGGTLTFNSSINSVHITEFVPTGGITDFYSDASIYTLAFNDSTVQFRANGCINSLSMDYKAVLTISSTTTLNILNSFNWNGTNQIESDANINGYNNSVGGVINLLHNCSTVFSSASPSNYIDHVEINNHGTLFFSPRGEGEFNLNDGAKIINHPTGSFFVEASALDPTISIAQDIHFENHGLVDVNVAGPYSFKVNNVFTNYGTLRLGNSKMETSEFVQHAGFTALDESGTLTASIFTIEGGIVTGKGTIVASNVEHNGGVIRPGNSIGTLYISGQYTKGVDSNLEIQVTSADNFDVLSVTGTATLTGQFTFIPINFVPLVGATFEVLTAQYVTGGFTSTASPDITINTYYVYSKILNVNVQSNEPAFTCSGGCGHGHCVGNNTCSCEEGYTGSDCTKFSCERIGGCVHGQCTAPTACTCDEYVSAFYFIHLFLIFYSGWIGLSCNESEPHHCFPTFEILCGSGCTDAGAINYDPSL
jgi:hypothetical protein